MLPSTVVSLLFSSECVSRWSGGGGIVEELAPSLLTAPWRKELLMLAGDVESNPGPYTDYTHASKDLCMVLMHIPTSSYLLTSKCNCHKITMWYVRHNFIEINQHLKFL